LNNLNLSPTTKSGTTTHYFVSNWELSLIILALILLVGFNRWIQMKFIQGFGADAKL
jgi:hypothetical protein